MYIPTLEDESSNFSKRQEAITPWRGASELRRTYVYTLILFIERVFEILLYGNMQSMEDI